MNATPAASAGPVPGNETEELTRRYWNLREEVRKDEGRLQELQNLILLIHNFSWK